MQCLVKSRQTDEPTDVPKGLEIGFPPRSIPRRGPGYLALSTEERRELVRLRNNLVHPEASLFAEFRIERKAEPKLVRAAGDYSCSACLETIPKPKNARPSAIHDGGDFGDVLGLDVAYWKNKQGKTFMFTHVICESTLFHMAVGAGRSPEEQFAALSDRWFSFAGVLQMIYVDPAGEYTSEFWKVQLQRENIKSKVSAAESHWQLGRVEAHGKIIKDIILSRLDSEQDIGNEQEFRLSLRQAIWAKNSLSRVKGDTPEQAVSCKMSRLPGSIASDSDASAHSLATSQCPEGVAFRRSLQRREQARSAFVKADNDNSYRRALLRRSRPVCQSSEAGDWILYWRVQKGGGSRLKGRWRGPGQVICSEGNKVVWVSHGGQLIRASSEQLRSASMREWQSVVTQQQQSFSAGNPGLSRTYSNTRRVVDLIGAGVLPAREDVDHEGDVPMGPTEEPEQRPMIEIPGPNLPPSPDVLEYSPDALGNTGSDGAQPEHEVSPMASREGDRAMDHAMKNSGVPEFYEVPVPEDDEDLLFGDTECFLAYPDQGQVWEMTLRESQIDVDDLPSAQQALEYVLLATPERKKRVEVGMRDLSDDERVQFGHAKDKEVGAWS